MFGTSTHLVHLLLKGESAAAYNVSWTSHNKPRLYASGTRWLLHFTGVETESQLLWPKGDKNLPDFELPQRTDLRDTGRSMQARFSGRKNCLTQNKKPRGEYVCFCRSLLSLWLFKHRGFRRVNSLSRKHQGITEVSVWPQVCGPEKPV